MGGTTILAVFAIGLAFIVAWGAIKVFQLWLDKKTAEELQARAEMLNEIIEDFSDLSDSERNKWLHGPASTDGSRK